ncbi:MAG: L-threonylcarbamoyladenylate synthase [Halanaerobiaceae bacterium]
MKTEVVKVDINLSPAEILGSEAVSKATRLLQQGEVVAIPTETVYGLAGDCFNPDAVAKIFAAKGRPHDNPLIVHISEHQDIYRVTPRPIKDMAFELITRFWPGPLTVILPKREELPYETTAGLDTVAIRMPSHPVTKAILARSGLILAAPSANSSGFPSPTRANHVLRDLNNKIPLIVDGGSCSVGLESTVVDVTGDVPVLLRPGGITAYQIEEVLGKKLKRQYEVERETSPKSPGLKYKHYSPRAEVVILSGKSPVLIWKEACKLKGRRALLITTETAEKINDLLAKSELKPSEECAVGKLEIFEMGSSKNPELIARRLFALLRDMDSRGFQTLLIEKIADSGLGEAVMNRLMRAASKVIELNNRSKG